MKAVVVLCLLILVVGLLFADLGSGYRDQCQKLMDLAQTRADSLQVYAATPGLYSGTCLDNLKHD